jgi:hypothetical protein
MIKKETLRQMLEKKIRLLQSGDPLRNIFTVYSMVRERNEEEDNSTKRELNIGKIVPAKS